VYLIAGLGNPGIKYENTRHNVGFAALDHLADTLGVQINKVKFKGLLGEATYEGKKILLLKPHTYMNLSGESVKDAVSFYKIPLENLIVIYDDMDLPVGRIRIRPGGSAGGHHGMESIIYQLASDKFPRVRIGIGHPEEGKDPVAHVLGNFCGEEIEKVKNAIQAAVKAALLIVSEGVNEAMNKYNSFEA